MNITESDTAAEKNPWYFTTATLLIALLTVGPLALPLVWFNPKFSLGKKVLWTAVTIILTYILVAITVDSVKKIMEQYKALGL